LCKLIPPKSGMAHVAAVWPAQHAHPCRDSPFCAPYQRRANATGCRRHGASTSHLHRCERGNVGEARPSILEGRRMHAVFQESIGNVGQPAAACSLVTPSPGFPGMFSSLEHTHNALDTEVLRAEQDAQALARMKGTPLHRWRVFLPRSWLCHACSFQRRPGHSSAS
jgi:hypothetical protein